MDALLDELFVLFSPQVFLIAGIKPLVDKSHHARIDELYAKARNAGGGGVRGVGGGSTSSATSLSINPTPSRSQISFLAAPSDNGNGGTEAHPTTPTTREPRGSGSEVGSPSSVANTIKPSPRLSSSRSIARSNDGMTAESSVSSGSPMGSNFNSSLASLSLPAGVSFPAGVGGGPVVKGQPEANLNLR